jgi:23S rRNA (adenine2030-N6)-methyltransferase
MLSYRHAFHAGNHADVLKHLLEVLILQYAVQKKGKPFRYIDTHAGPGTYSLHESFASKNREFDTGVARLWKREDLPAALESYVNVLRSFNATEELSHYPGSPAIAAKILYPGHRLQLFELHPDDAARLKRWKPRDAAVSVAMGDGFSALNAILPPAEKRALIMIDPPYEIKSDYDRAIAALQLGCKKFATGIYALWYPLLDRSDVTAFVRKLERMPLKSLLVELPIRPIAGDGMHGSGMFVINPPWILQEQLEGCLPYLQGALASADAPPWRLLCRDGSR